MAVGKAVTDALEDQGMQQRELADRSGVSPAIIREIQNGVPRRRSPRTWQGISEALGWPSRYLADAIKYGLPAEHPPVVRPPAVTSAEARVAKLSVPAGDQSTFITKLLFLLEQRFGRVVDVLYNDDSKFDITIEIKRSPREDDNSARPPGEPA
jgi:transcriptional regulator with XRE-family HTH domain